MNNTASPKRTDSPGLAWIAGDRNVPTVIATLLLCAILISLRPFQPSGADLDPNASGDIVNQLGFSMIGAVALFSALTYVNPRILVTFLSPWWILLFGFFGLSILNALDPAGGMRAGLFTLIGVITVIVILALPPDADAFSTMLATAGFGVVGLSYLGVFLLPGLGTHDAVGPEADFVGLWRGVFSHKNIAGPVMAGFSFAGIYLYRRGRTLSGLALFVLALIFLANTGSKTAAGLVPVAIAIVALPGLIGMRFLTVVLVSLLLVGTALATLGMVFIEPIQHLMLSYFPDLTYTGRTTIWEFAGEMIMKRPWTGYGFESFWKLIAVATTDNPFDREWDVRTSVHGHNGYIDIALSMGLPALGIAIITFLIIPMIDYLRIPLRRENVLLGDFFMMTFLFTVLNAFLESFFFRRVDPVWLFFLISVMGLRMTARRIIPTK